MPAVAKKDQTVAHTGENSGETVTVACKVPMGLVLRVHGVIETSEQTANGPRPAKMYPMLKEYTVKGPGHEAGQRAMAETAGGYALTRGIPREFWDKWMEEFADSPLVLNGQIFAASRPSIAAGRAAEQKELTSGMEPLRVGKDARIPKPTNPASGTIQPDEERSMPVLDDEEV